ncbi:MAG: TRAM domain-containing protein [Thermoplasmata archaeon]
MKMQDDSYGIDPMKAPPVIEGKTYSVKIESIGREGDGIAKIEGFVVFIPKTEVGEELDVRINKVTRRVAFGERVGEEETKEEKGEEETEELPTEDSET